MNDESGNDEGVGRREFLRSGVTGAGLALTLAGCGSPEHALIPALIPEDRIIPGTDRWTVTTCVLCPGTCGAMVRTMAGVARVVRGGREFRQEVLQVKKIEGNPASTAGSGGLCARGQAAPNVLYHPDRFRRPMRLAGPRGSARHEEISWDDAIEILVRELAPLKTAGRHPGLAVILGSSSSLRRRPVVELIQAAGSDLIFEMDHPGFPTLREANRRTFGLASLETHDLANARYVLAFAAPFLEAHTSPVAYARALADMRRARPGQRGRFVQIESRLSLTAANADEWVPVRPGFEGDLALSIVGEILRDGLVDDSKLSARVRGLEELREAVRERFHPERVAFGSGVSAETIRRIAREFAASQPAVALAGGSALAHPGGVAAAGAVQALNVLVGAVGQRGGIRLKPPPTQIGRRDGNNGWMVPFQSALSSIRTLILWDSDPLGSVPRASALGKALQVVPFVVSFATLPNESCAYADLILPDASFLERWDLCFPEASVPEALTLSQPVVRRLHESRDAVDVLMEAVAEIQGTQRETAGGGFMESLVRGEFEKWVGGRAGEEDSWETLKRTGCRIAPGRAEPVPVADLSWLARTAATEPAPVDEFPLHLQPFPTAQFGYGEASALPWLQELPDPMTSIVWSSWIEIDPETAKRHGIDDGDIVRVESRAGGIEAPAYISRAARPDTVSIPFGQCRQAAGRYTAGRGANPWDLVEDLKVEGAGESAWAATRVRLTRTSRKARVARLGDDRGPAPAGLMRKGEGAA